jgi:hypothetical protein
MKKRNHDRALETPGTARTGRLGYGRESLRRFSFAELHGLGNLGPKRCNPDTLPVTNLQGESEGLYGCKEERR